MVSEREKTNRRLIKAYGITLEEYEQMLADQGGVCKICGNPPKKNRLSTDHDHRFTKTKYSKIKHRSVWSVWVGDPMTSTLIASDKRLRLAIRAIKHQLKRESVRGLLCVYCNRGLRFFNDDPRKLLSAAAYITEFQNKTRRV